MNKIKLTALSTTVVERNHALITGDGFVNSAFPQWTDCEINVVINEAMGANFCQLITTMTPKSKLLGKTLKSQIFFYVLSGTSIFKINEKEVRVTEGGYIYIPVNEDYEVFNAEENTRMLSFHKVYEPLKNIQPPKVVINNRSEVKQSIYCEDPNLLMQNLLPDQEDLSFDMAINIFKYNPGANLPFVECHIMEHGLMYLEGQGIYRLDNKWYPVKKDDCIWMAPYCPQWFGALGTEPAVYIYYKNVNRFPTVI